VNLSYLLEGLTYFGVVGLLAIYFNNFIGLNDIDAGRMVGVLTAGITISMLFLGATVDFIGPRKAILISLSFMLIGRILLGSVQIYFIHLACGLPLISWPWREYWVSSLDMVFINLLVMQR